MSDTNTQQILDYMRDVKNDLAGRIDKLESEIRSNYVTIEAFNPVQRIVYGLVGAILLAFITAITGLILIGS